MKTCIITGASDGIGREVAKAISHQGFFKNIVLISRNESNLRQTESLMSKDTNIIIKPFDLLHLDEIPNLIKRIYILTDSIDCLINVAGYADPQPLFSTSIENLEKTYRINVFAPILLSKECSKYMKNFKNTKIINVASTAGITSRPGWISYSSSKAAMISLSNTLSDELAEYGIKIYTVSPGRCATTLRKKLAPDEDQSTIMQPEDVANIIAQLVSPYENFLDGQNIIIRKKNL
jgi:short-subunit dehydrogenase